MTTTTTMTAAPTANKRPVTLTGTQKSAVLLLLLEEDSAAAILKALAYDEVQRVSMEMVRLGNLSHEAIHAGLDDFIREAGLVSSLGAGSNERLRTMLTKALGAESAAMMLDDIHDSAGAGKRRGIGQLNQIKPATVVEAIKDEHPQIIATILIHLERSQAAEVIELFEDALRNDVLLRIATFSGIQPLALQELTESLGHMLEGQNLKHGKLGGAKAAAEILNLIAMSQEEMAIETIRTHDEALAALILSQMFLFDDILKLDDRTVQRILKDVDTNKLAVALKGAKEPLREKFLQNMSKRAAEIFRDNMEISGVVPQNEAEAEQKGILMVIRRLADIGEIRLPDPDETIE